MARGGGTVFDVDLAPSSAKAVPVLTAIAGAAAVVEVDDGDTAAREELDLKVESGCDVRRRSSVDEHDERRQLVGRSGIARIHRGVVEAVRDQAVGTREVDRLCHRDVALVQLQLCRAAQDLSVARVELELDDRRGLCRRGGREDESTAVTPD